MKHIFLNIALIALGFLLCSAFQRVKEEFAWKNKGNVDSDADEHKTNFIGA